MRTEIPERVKLDWSGLAATLLGPSNGPARFFPFEAFALFRTEDLVETGFLGFKVLAPVAVCVFFFLTMP